MGFCYRRFRQLSFSTLLVAGLSAAAFAGGSHDRTQFGHDIVVASGEEIGEATCFGCSVRVRGQVSGDVTTFGGSVITEEGGNIGGDATSFGGSVRLEAKSKIGGDLTVFGGAIHRDPESAIGGDVTNFSGGFWLVLIFVMPFIVLGAFIALIVWAIGRLTRPALPAAVEAPLPAPSPERLPHS